MASPMARLASIPVHLRARLRRNAAFREVFGVPGNRTPAQELVLGELARFCNANAELFGPTPEETAYNVGKFRVFQHVRGIVGMSDDDVLRLVREPPTSEE